MPRPRPAQLAILLVAAAAIIAWQVELVGDWRVDDAYITFSYAKNLAQDRGPIYSHDVRVEGYSNFLWMLLLAFGYRLFPLDDPYPLARGLAFGFLALGGWATYRLMRRRARFEFAAAGLAALALSTDLVRATVSGLETVSYTALLTLAVLVYLEEPRGKPRWSLLAFLPVALTRIDGFVPALFLVVFELGDALYQKRLQPRLLLRWLAWPVALYLVYFAWRWSYYGLPLPTTYYAKTLVDASDPNRGVNYALDAFFDLGLAAALPFVVLAVFWLPSRDAAFLGALSLYHVAYVVRVGGDWMPFWRFWIPIAPLVFALFVWGLQQTWDAAQRLFVNPVLQGLIVLLTLSPLAFVAVRIDGHSIDSTRERDKINDAAEVARHTHAELLAALPLLRWVLRAPGERLVTDYGGVFSFHTDASIIEMWGLCNSRIALQGNTKGINPVYGKTCPRCYRDFDPDYFHTKTPLVRDLDAFRNHRAVIKSVFQGPAIDRQIDLRYWYATGRVVEIATGKALYFLERRRPGFDLVRRVPRSGIVVEYPFEKKRRSRRSW